MSVWRRFRKKHGTRDVCQECNREDCPKRRKPNQGPRQNCSYKRFVDYACRAIDERERSKENDN